MPASQAAGTLVRDQNATLGFDPQLLGDGRREILYLDSQLLEVRRKLPLVCSSHPENQLAAWSMQNRKSAAGGSIPPSCR